MNNSFLASESATLQDPEKVDRKPILRQREGELVKLVEAIQGVTETEEWKTLKSHIFDPTVDKLERMLVNEANAPEINTTKMYRLQGQIIWAKKYANLDEMANKTFKVELESIRKELNEQNS